jgi:hypothetical protein
MIASSCEDLFVQVCRGDIGGGSSARATGPDQGSDCRRNRLKLRHAATTIGRRGRGRDVNGEADAASLLRDALARIAPDAAVETDVQIDGRLAALVCPNRRLVVQLTPDRSGHDGHFARHGYRVLHLSATMVGADPAGAAAIVAALLEGPIAIGLRPVGPARH